MMMVYVGHTCTIFLEFLHDFSIIFLRNCYFHTSSLERYCMMVLAKYFLPGIYEHVCQLTNWAKCKHIVYECC